MNPDATKRNKRIKKGDSKPGETSSRDGDVFMIPLDNGKAYLGQVIATPNYANTYIVIFDFLANEKDAARHVDEALSSSPLLAGLTITPFKGRPTWKIIMNRPLTSRDADRFLPAYFASVRGKKIIEDFYRKRSRPASPDEEAAAFNAIVNNRNAIRNTKLITARRSISAATFEAALRAINGLETWNERYADLCADRVVLARDVFGSQC